MTLLARTCPRCAKAFSVPKSQKRIRFCSRVCGANSHPPRNRKSEVWGLHANGYINGYVYRDGVRVQTKQHRFVVERVIGRRLLPTEIVHHINGDRADNRPENLQVLDQATHTRIHWSEANGPLRKIPRRKSHCPSGHPYSGANLYVWKGDRGCRACRAEQSRKRNRKLLLLRRTAKTQPNMDAR